MATKQPVKKSATKPKAEEPKKAAEKAEPKKTATKSKPEPEEEETLSAADLVDDDEGEGSEEGGGEEGAEEGSEEAGEAGEEGDGEFEDPDDPEEENAEPSGPSYKHGIDSFEQAKSDPRSAGKGMYLFRVPYDATKRVIFLDVNVLDKEAGPPCEWMHEYKRGDEFGSFFCIQQVDRKHRCPGCYKKLDNSWVCLLTLLDLGTKMDREKPGFKPRRRVMVCKEKTLAALVRKVKAHGDLGGSIYTIYRSAEKRSMRVGEEFTFVKRVPIKAVAEKFGKENAVPFPQNQIIRYSSFDELSSFVEGVSVRKHGDDTGSKRSGGRRGGGKPGGSGDDEDISF